ncbi:AIM24 family protein [Paenibacillus filicis]|uniref:AIM24 family protein n=1 Tax=Paenibacillus gyeongsangnamensis TaxID=3388067 RepID=A0ABT4QAN2_9BACL|nr:AIM24 family protein [Paenibacillus filicis]MCZ8513901.1 AIM24 family protein [Paenibacillus filicis]
MDHSGLHRRSGGIGPKPCTSFRVKWTESRSNLTLPNSSWSLAALELEEGEAVHVLHPNQIVAFRGASSQREDSLMKLSGMYRKKRMIQSCIRGKSRFLLGLPDGYILTAVNIAAEDDLLFEFRHVLFYTEGMKFRTHIQTVAKALMTRDLVRMRFEGPGTLGLLTSGPLYELALHPTEPLFVDTACLVAYPRQSQIRPCVYGNTLASQHMNYQWELTGQGSVLIQPCKPDKTLDDQMQSNGLIRRVLRELLPFGGVFIK